MRLSIGTKLYQDDLKLWPMRIYHQRARYVRHGDDFAIEVDLVREASVTILFSKVSSTDMSDKEKSSGNFNVPIQVVSEPRQPG